jgi:hypothetical protein
MKKLQAPRNGGRNKVSNGTVVRLTVPKDKVQELKEFAKTLRIYEKRKHV